MASTNISVEIDETEINGALRKALGVLAREQNVSIAKLVRDAIDAELGDELAPLILYFASNDTSVAHLIRKSVANDARIAAIGGD